MKTKFLTETAIIGAIYVALTLLLSPISFGPLQVRVSEALTILPALTPAAIPGLFIGCAVANIIGPYGIYDVIFGSIATLAASFLTYLIRKKNFLVPLPPVIINAVVIGAMLHFIYGVPNLLMCICWVGLGQTISCYGIGYPLLKILKKNEHRYIFEGTHKKERKR